MSTKPAVALLYVEDDPLIREVTVMSLEDAGFEVVMAENASAAFAALAQGARGIEVVITDINLGTGPDGWEVARRARQVKREMLVLYVTGAEGDGWQSKAVPGSRIIGKPFSPIQIVTAVLSLLCRA